LLAGFSALTLTNVYGWVCRLQAPGAAQIQVRGFGIWRMLTIRDAAWDKLAETAHADFVVRMRVHLRKFFSEQCDTLGEVRTGQLIEFGITRAREHGFESERDVCKYIDLMCVFGHRFDRDDRLPGARHILESRSPVDPGERMLRLHRIAIGAARRLVDGKELGATP
jgi:hypothetical protein